MKHITLSLLAAFLIGGQMLHAQTLEAVEDGKYRIATGDVAMIIDAAHGGKILSFSCRDKEILSQSSIPNAFGSTFWTSPQADWNWPPVPEYDSKPYKAEIKDGTLILTGQKSEKFGCSVRKEFRADPKDNAIVITYAVINNSQEVRKVAPWEISRVPNEGLVFFQADEATPANNMKGISFTFEKGAAWYMMDESQDNRKINADGTGWLALCANGLMMVKKFQDLDKSEPAPAEAEIQIYVNRGRTFVEIEEQGPYTALQPGEEVEWTVRWYLMPYDLQPVPSGSLLKKALKTVK